MEIINIIKQLSKNSLSIAHNTVKLMQLEITLAKKSLPVMAGLFFLLLCLIISMWVFLLGLLITYLAANGFSIYSLLFSVLGIHLLLIIIIGLLMRKYIGNMKLHATRKHLRTMFSSNLSNKP